MEYQIIRSRRRTVSLEVRPDRTVLVRSPLRMSGRQIEEFVKAHEKWLADALQRAETRQIREAETDLREEELKKAAKEYLPARTEYWAGIMNLSPSGVKITSAKARFGSCSAKNRICYSWRLMAYPPEGIDYVIVHELAHILQKNHSAKFYAVVETYLPDWRRRKALLK